MPDRIASHLNLLAGMTVLVPQRRHSGEGERCAAAITWVTKVQRESLHGMEAQRMNNKAGIERDVVVVVVGGSALKVKVSIALYTKTKKETKRGGKD